MHIHFKVEIFFPNRDVIYSSFGIFKYSVISNNTKFVTPRIPYAIVKELCSILDISNFHEYASIWPH